MLPDYKRTKRACYFSYFSMSSVFCLPPLLFVTFHEMYGISYTLLGTLVLTNFCTQLGIDLIFTVFSKKFDIPRVIKIMPLLTCLGLLVYAIVPSLWPEHAYLGLLTGTVIFSVAAGLSEVLLSPLIAAIPSEHPERDMSLLHSLYAFGVLAVVAVSTLVLRIIGNENWMYLTLFWAALPVITSVMFCLSPFPDMQDHGEAGGKKGRGVGLALFVACIFFGSWAENSMNSWISGFMEQALHIDKTLGDILGMALFAVLLGAVRIWYARYGKHINIVLMVGMLGAAVCYLVAGLSRSMLPAFVACVTAGLFTGILWPGSLIAMEERLPGMGVAAYALMAAGGDMGASFGPQLLGAVADRVSAAGADMAASLGMTPDQLGLKAAMLLTAVFPLLGAVVVILIMCYFGKEEAAR